ncbi:MAG: vitamin K epoxide reductase family protein [Dehalococcoidia bacterium]|nr:vitamin K epoxide reductase family protein [Dehalococcoidia bacterium]
MRNLWIGALVFALMGVGITSYMTVTHLSGASVACIGGGGCDEVPASRFAYLAGIPLPYLGLGFYLTVTALLLAGWRHKLSLDVVLPALLLLTLSGALFSGYLTGLQAAVIGAFCTWCLASAVTETTLLALSITLLWVHSRSVKAGAAR